MTFCSNETIHIVVYAETIQKLEVVKSLRERPKKEKHHKNQSRKEYHQKTNRPKNKTKWKTTHICNRNDI